ncbi:MAG: metallophosphoesterase [Bacillota bacterium]|nr:metallophosphoesterase [Bacillota bacterium]
MRLLVVSDTHGDFYNLNKVILAQPKAEVIIHCGDGEQQVEDCKSVYSNRMFLSVCGNCDFCSSKPPTIIRNIAGKTVFITHGHMFGVKSDTEQLVSKAKEHGAEILLFGHTHQPLLDYRDGLYILNPGSLKGLDGTYGIVDITSAGIVTNIIHI